MTQVFTVRSLSTWKSHFEKQNPSDTKLCGTRGLSNWGRSTQRDSPGLHKHCKSPEHEPTHSTNLTSVGDAQVLTCQTRQAGVSSSLTFLKMHSQRLYPSWTNSSSEPLLLSLDSLHRSQWICYCCWRVRSWVTRKQRKQCYPDLDCFNI